MDQQQIDPLWESFIANNSVIVDDNAYSFDRDAYDALLTKRPWQKDEHYFKKCKISLLALVRILQHAKQGGQIEVMGYFRGKIVHDTYVVTDAYPLPVEGTETRVNAGREAEEYAGQFNELCETVDQVLNADEEKRRNSRLVPFPPELWTLAFGYRCEYPEKHANSRTNACDSH